jgi:hypothetical protein
MKFRTDSFPNNGFLTVFFSDDELLPIRNEIENIISENFRNSKEYNKRLVGNIKKQFEIVDSKKHIEKMISPLCLEHDKVFAHLKNTSFLSKDVSLTLQSAWVNIQEKCEFNPTHNHTGLYSFVIWLEIPYVSEVEKKNEHSIKSNYPVSGSFEFVYSDILGKIKTFEIPVDKSFRNFGLIFPSELNHCVYPFFTSDDYRISVSGNISLMV